MRRFAVIAVLFTGIPLGGYPLWGQSPGVGKHAGHNQKQQTGLRAPQAQPDQRGTPNSPIVVDVLSHPKSEKEAAEERKENNRKALIDRWSLSIAAIVAIFTGLLVIIGWRGVRAANRTLRTVERQADLIERQATIMERQAIEGRDTAAQQAKDVQASIAESTRAAKAMEGIAESMATNVESVRESVGITREIANRQKLITELQSRAYLALVFELMVPQNIAAGVRFEPRMRIENSGNTPAHNIRFAIVADVLPFPLRDDFVFPLPAETLGRASIIGPGLHKIIVAVVPKLYTSTEEGQITSGIGQRVATWGIVRYQDAFDIERFVKFGFTHYRMGDTNQWMSMDTPRHNDAN